MLWYLGAGGIDTSRRWLVEAWRALIGLWVERTD